MNALLALPSTVALSLVDTAPDDKDVKAGWTAFVIFLLLVASVAVIGYFVTRSLKIAARAKDQGAYGDEPVVDDEAAEPAEPVDPAVDQAQDSK